MANDKAELRRRILAARRERPAEERARADAALSHGIVMASFCRPDATVAAYVPVGGEPGSISLLDTLRIRGVRVLLPVVTTSADGDRALDWAEYAGADQLTDGPLGLLQPVGPRLGPSALATVDGVLAPALAVDHYGNRLGRGAGYYDRALATVPAGVPVVAVLYDDEWIDDVPAEPHDRAVTGVLTPTGGLRAVSSSAATWRLGTVL